ncbi:MAG: AAA family ATPase, partial [Planctomycetales bacterium]
MSTETTKDPREIAFCSPQAPEIFRSVACPTEVWTPDPFDVPTVFADARAVFDRLLDRATSPNDRAGRVLLIKGESGAGKTHLMRAFRAAAHGRGQAYFAYMQMTTAGGNYLRYLLNKLIDSLDQPYDRPRSGESGLRRLSRVLVERDSLDTSQLRRLRGETVGGNKTRRPLTDDERIQLVNDLADQVLEDAVFQSAQANGDLHDLLRAMLYLQCDRLGVRQRAMKYLRGEDLGNSDRAKLDLAPLHQDQQVQSMIERLGKLIWTLQGSALVLCIDQLDDFFRAGRSEELLGESQDSFRRAIQALTSISAAVPSSVTVISCLSDY